MKLSPAEYVIRVFGSVRETARAVDRDESCVSRWKAPKSKGGTGGKIPGPVQDTILKKARRKNLDITPHDLVYGREVLA